MAIIRRHFFYRTAALAVFVVLLDRLAKAAALLIWNNNPVEIIQNILSFSFAKNVYISFSLNTKIDPLFFIVPIIIALLIYFVNEYKNRRLFEASALFYILCGAASNLFDRIKYGYVIDYIDLSYFTVFNLADAMITIGVIALIVKQFSKR